MAAISLDVLLAEARWTRLERRDREELGQFLGQATTNTTLPLPKRSFAAATCRERSRALPRTLFRTRGIVKGESHGHPHDP